MWFSFSSATNNVFFFIGFACCGESFTSLSLPTVSSPPPSPHSLQVHEELEAIGAASAESRARRILAVSYSTSYCVYPSLVFRTRTHTRTHTHACTHARTRTHARTHAHTHTHTHTGVELHGGDAGKSHQEILWRLEDESLVSQVGVVRGCGLLTILSVLCTGQGSVHGTNATDVGRTHQPPGLERRHMAQQVNITFCSPKK